MYSQRVGEIHDMKLHGDGSKLKRMMEVRAERPAERHALGWFADMMKKMQRERSSTSNTLACHKAEAAPVIKRDGEFQASGKGNAERKQ